MSIPFALRPSGLEQLALCGGWTAGTVVALMWGYFDESGEHGHGGKLKRLTIGGFYSRFSSIQALSRAWREALAAESLSAFHMKDIASDEHNYANWPPERKRRLDLFVSILCENALAFGAYSYPVRDGRRAFVDAYQPGLARALIKLEDLCQDTGERGHIVFAKTSEISERLIGRYFEISNWSDWLDGYAVMRSSREPALQAAEIVARGMKQFMQDGGITYSFGRILATRKPVMFWPPAPAEAVSAYPHLLLWGRA